MPPTFKLYINGFGEAHIHLNKLTQYALNPDKAPDKALAFEKALDYNLNNVDKLIENVISHINDFKPERKPATIHGEPFQILLKLTGEEVRLTSIYIKKRKK